MDTVSYTNPLPLTQELLRCRSVTPIDDGALDLLESVLIKLGFRTWRTVFSSYATPEVDNLYARLGTEGHNFCFAGHIDVVPPGQGWCVDPFSGTCVGQCLFGRGAVDMKGAIACFVSAVARSIQYGKTLSGSISLLITGDEEGPSLNGTAKMITWLKRKKEVLDACLVGEPTNPNQLGEMIKIGRRGSLNIRLKTVGVQGHAAYPELADNPINHLLDILSILRQFNLDNGSQYFQPSVLTVTSLDVGNQLPNVIPFEASAALNVRFNDCHTGESVKNLIRKICESSSCQFSLESTVSGESFLSTPGLLAQIVRDTVYNLTGIKPQFSTSGGTSDARFLKEICPVVEFGLVGKTMHKANESTSITDLEMLTEIYRSVLDNYFLAMS